MKFGTCTYCGQQARVTSDHVPPKCLFARPLPQKMITVPACESCNNGFKLDDEYFKLCVSMRPDVLEGSHSHLWASSLRALQKPEARKFRERFYSSLREVELQSEAGLYLGDATGFLIDARRLRSTATRMLRGLYFHYVGRRLPDTHSAHIFYHDFQKDDSAIRSAEIQEVLAHIRACDALAVGSGVLRVQYAHVNDDLDSSAWLFTIVDSLSFFGFTYLKERIQG